MFSDIKRQNGFSTSRLFEKYNYDNLIYKYTKFELTLEGQNSSRIQISQQIKRSRERAMLWVYDI